MQPFLNSPPKTIKFLTSYQQEDYDLVDASMIEKDAVSGSFVLKNDESKTARHQGIITNLSFNQHFKTPQKKTPFQKTLVQN